MLVSGLGLALFVALSWLLRFAGQGSFPAIDALLYFLPLYDATYPRVLHGTLPLWNPYQLCGEPWLASLQGGLFYPGHVLYLFLPLPRAYAASGVLHLVIAALATFAFCRRAGLGTAPAFLGAVVFALRGRMPYGLVQPNFLEAVAWLPLGALGVLEITGGARRRGIAILALATGLSVLAGYPQPTVYAVYAWTLLLLVLLAGKPAAWRDWLGAGGAYVAGGALGGLAAAVQLFPAAELTRIGVRATQELDPGTIAQMGFITPAPFILGRGAIAGDPHAYGVVVLTVVVAALVTARHRALAVWAFVLAAISALFALASWGPLFRLYLALPFLSWFRYPHRILVLTDFAVAVAVAIGLDALLDDRDRRRLPALVTLAGLALVVVLAVRGAAPPATLRAVAVGAGAALVSMILVLRGGWARRGAVLALVALALVEVSRTGWHGVRLPYTAAETQAYVRHAPYWQDLATRAGSDRVWVYRGGLVATLASKLATLYGFRAIDDYEPLSTRRQAEYFNYLSEGSPRIVRPPYIFQGSISSLEPPPDIAPAATRRRLLDLAALRFLAMPAGRRTASPVDDAFVRDGGFEPGPPFIPGVELYENPHALPRAFVTYRTRNAPPTDELLARLAAPDFDPMKESYVEGAPETGSTAAPPGHPARIVLDGESTVEIEATLAADGFIVLADAFYPGWRATVDGLPVAISPTNHLFRGVPVPPGSHRIRFDYRPRSLWVGALASVVASLAILVLLTSRRVSRRLP
jgi:hypothetical protein